MSDPRIFKHWVLTGKSSDGVMIYSRKDEKSDVQRDGLELKPNGELVRYKVSPSGSVIRASGKYTIDGNTLYTHFNNHYLDSLYKIVDLDDNVLKII